MNKYLELFLGIVLLVVGIWGIWRFAIPVSTFAGTGQVRPVLIFIEGIWGILVALIGLLFLILGISDLKE